MRNYGKISEDTNLMIVYAPHYVAGIVYKDQDVLATSNILKWTKTKSIDWLKKYFNRKGYRYLIRKG